MSDLQVSLLIIGAIVVGGVTAFNWFQQWRLRRRLEEAFGDKHEDVLLREAPPREAGAERVEPQLDPQHRRIEPELTAEPELAVEAPPAPPAPPAPVYNLPEVPGFDPVIDYVAAIDAAEPISAAGLAELHTKAAASGKRF